jgi:branched-chain amino acid transport system substrate-binding protein
MTRLLGTTALAFALPLSAAAEVRVGMLVTLSGPAALLGEQARDGFQLALDKLGGTLGGQPATFLVEDDELKPDVALTKLKALTERDGAQIVVGTIFSNILQAIYRPATESGVFLISPNAGPSSFAGENCHPNFFVTSYLNNQNYEALGVHANERGFQRVFMLAPNYQAGRDATTGFTATFGGQIADEVYTPLGHNDFSAEIARIATSGADALFVFMPGGMGVRFVKQFAAAGLTDRIPVLSAFTVDETTLPAQQDDALGMFGVAGWAPDLDNPTSAAFVEAFEAKYGYVPGTYAAQAFDTAMLIDSAVRASGGVANADAFRDALRAAQFDSVRGQFAFNTNHYPIQDFYLVGAVKREDGKFATTILQKILEDATDTLAADCKM